VTSYAREERALEEREYQDDVRAAASARTVDQLRDLSPSPAALRDALRQRAATEQAPERRDLRQAIERCAAMWETQECDGRCSRCEAS
jgi:hypothetical protein